MTLVPQLDLQLVAAEGLLVGSSWTILVLGMAMPVLGLEASAISLAGHCAKSGPPLPPLATTFTVSSLAWRRWPLPPPSRRPPGPFGLLPASSWY